ncbi:radical SAM protein [Thermosediminibacter oceani]|uniref:Radical SAM domain protein n=1 Tax=Thermosediminibacter oceani (strain ATCC BAA-1034 / DSM 16646 / JW/IW-1228P) TaxID=555079 RepID=D9S2H5_THEOJ|nr:radical SAM protein [Thermosediminibacter oceani]ADL07602.1 Radical SAM domain protein [Thermosediminibacter oceani DSM 16646]
MLDILENCRLCPRSCGVNRLKGECGFCGASDRVVVAKAFAHRWEEPCISGDSGSGTVFFSGCNLRCVFCQNYRISQEWFGKAVSEDDLVEIFLNLQAKGVHNINLVTPTIYTPQLAGALKKARQKGLFIPVIWNSNSYENPEALKILEGLVDVYLPDIKYFDSAAARKYSGAGDYFDRAAPAVLEMYRQVGEPVFDDKGIIKRGLIIRHLVLPGLKEDSKKILEWIKSNLPGGVYVSLMSQYMPCYRAGEFPEINRVLSIEEYEEVIDYFFELGLENGFAQEEGANSAKYVPDFDLEGIP